MSEKLQLNLNASRANIDATPESAGVAATPGSVYSYYSADFVASSLFKQGDVGILGTSRRFADAADESFRRFDTDIGHREGRVAAATTIQIAATAATGASFTELTLTDTTAAADDSVPSFTRKPKLSGP